LVITACVLYTVLADRIVEIQVRDPQVARFERSGRLLAIGEFEGDLFDVDDPVGQIHGGDFAFLAGEIATGDLDGVPGIDTDPAGTVLLAEIPRQRGMDLLVAFVKRCFRPSFALLARLS
jgi:hypothetical protein